MQQFHHSLIALPERLPRPTPSNLVATGWANAYYSATVQAGSQDWLAHHPGAHPVATLMFHFNNPDALLTPLLGRGRLRGY
jgi:hypothetical protein